MIIINRKIKLSKSITDYFNVIFGTVFGRGLSSINSIIIARTLGPSQFGIYSLFFAVMTTSWLISTAFDTVHIRFAKGVDELDKKNTYLVTSVILKILCSLIMLICFYLGDLFLHDILLSRYFQSKLVYQAIICGLFINFQMSLSNYFREKEQFILSTLISNLYTVIVFVVFISLLLIKINISVVIIINLFFWSAIILGFFSFIYIIRQPFKFPDFKTVLELFSWGKWVFFLALVFFVFERIDVFFLSKFMTESDVGVYSAATQLLMIISVPIGAMGQVFIPKVVDMFKSKIGLRNYIYDSIIPILLIVLIIIVLIPVSPFVMKLLYGPEYSAAIDVFRIKALSWLFVAFFLPLSYIFYAIDMPDTRFWLELIKLFCGIILLFFFVPAYGIIGGAISIAMSIVVYVLCSSAVLFYILKKKDYL